MLESKLIDENNAATAEQVLEGILKNDMTETIPNWSDKDTEQVLEICKTVGYKNLLKTDWNPQNRTLEYRCVQDADLLDAIGAVGVARCFAFGGKRGRLMFGVANTIGANITAEQYKLAKGSGVEHFFDKLLLIRGMMTTPTGTATAVPRHNNMVQFLQTLEEELQEGGDYDTLDTSVATSSAAGTATSTLFTEKLAEYPLLGLDST